MDNDKINFQSQLFFDTCKFFSPLIAFGKKSLRSNQFNDFFYSDSTLGFAKSVGADLGLNLNTVYSELASDFVGPAKISLNGSVTEGTGSTESTDTKNDNQQHYK
jgi:hypothetical protein